jgi:hypothetical protein
MLQNGAQVMQYNPANRGENSIFATSVGPQRPLLLQKSPAGNFVFLSGTQGPFLGTKFSRQREP